MALTTWEITGTPGGTTGVEEIIVPLGAFVYRLTFRFDFRTRGWTLDIDNYPGTRLVTGVRVRPGINLFSAAPGRGVLHVVPTDGVALGGVDLDGFARGAWRLYWDPTWEGLP